ncbi:PREDICTED: elicitor-responsive protein 1-like [Nelumbo nucifera]|uniref:Elicitor-responsive protein 1-like n=1 Tax=Nelumbo nucifera TaxID=4432 RepID=A0A1U8A6A1_NELNU|nr:PREDICTED: elicitor-responsive protein 1-like [Nelumbo nucifera]
MPIGGILELLLVDATNLGGDRDFVGEMDPYVYFEYKNQKLRSNVARGQGANPVWNEKFSHWVQYPEEDDQYILTIRVMDKDKFSRDDSVGQTMIDVRDLVALGVEKGMATVGPCRYSVVGANGTRSGEIQVGFTFKPKMLECGPGSRAWGA